MKTKKKEAQIIPLYPGNDRAEELKRVGYISAAWSMARASFWYQELFSKQRTQRVKWLVKKYFESKGYSNKTLGEFLERIGVMLLHQSRTPGVTLPDPESWFDPENISGFHATEEMYKAIVQKRKTAKEHEKWIKWVADGIIHYIEDPTKETYMIYLNHLINWDQVDLFPVYNATITSLEYMSDEPFLKARA